jgi:uncharacterized membrane protein
MIAVGVIIALAGAGLVWLAVASWRGRLPRNGFAGVRIPSTMRSDAAFRVANMAAAPLLGVGGVVLMASGVLPTFLPASEAGPCLLAGTLTLGVMAIAGGAIGARAARKA